MYVEEGYGKVFIGGKQLYELDPSNKKYLSINRASGGWLSTVFSDRTMGLTNQDKLWNIQSRVIEELAEKGSCVIVGRCADYILRGKADCLNVFIHASMEREISWRLLRTLQGLPGSCKPP